MSSCYHHTWKIIRRLSTTTTTKQNKQQQQKGGVGGGGEHFSVQSKLWCISFLLLTDDIPPTIECPTNMVQEFSEENQEINVQFLPSHLTKLTDNVGTKPPMFTPSGITFKASTAQLTPTFPPFRSYEITASVEDTSGNVASCQFELLFRRKLELSTLCWLLISTLQ